MNSLHPYRAFASQQCPSPCTDSPVFTPGCRYKGVDASSCDAAQKQFNSTNKTGVINTTKPSPAPRVVRHQRLTPATTPAKINATGNASIGAGGTASVGAGTSAPATGSISGIDLPSGIDDIFKPITDFFNSLGLPSTVFGLSTPILLGIGVGGLLLLLVLR